MVGIKRVPVTPAKLDALIRVAPTSYREEEAKEILAGLARVSRVHEFESHTF